MAFVLLRNRKVLAIVALLVALTGAALVWWQREPLQTWYSLRGLAAATDADRDAWSDRVAALDQAAVPGLMASLATGEAAACANAVPALVKLGERWDMEDSRRSELAGRLAEAYPRLPSCGQRAVLEACTIWVTRGAPSGVVHAASRLPSQVARSEDAAVRAGGMELVAALLNLPNHAELIADCRDLAKVCLSDAEPGNRRRATLVAAHSGLGLLEEVTPLLEDPVAEVRRAALRAVGPVRSVVSSDGLLHFLHDADADMRVLCEAVLRGRGFQGKHLRLARLITDPRSTVRLEVLQHLQTDTELEPGVWLRRLSSDPAPEVRAAAIRAAVENPVVDLSDRLQQMAEADPSPTVAQLARYYLTSQAHRGADR